MFFVGVLVVIGCVMGGYIGAGGHLMVLWQPLEFLIILGAAVGAYIIANPSNVLAKTGASFKKVITGSSLTKKSYLDLLALLYTIFKLARSKGMLAIESHIENPHESEIFSKYPEFMKDHHAVDFVCDYLRLMTMGSEDPNQMEDLMNQELEAHHAELHQSSMALTNVGDGLPALGIVAAVLGVIHTMGLISEPPEILGKSIGGALVGTFFGVLVAYGFVGPMAQKLTAVHEAESKYYECIKVAILAHMNGFAPAISIEYARKVLTSDVRPTFTEVEEAVQGI